MTVVLGVGGRPSARTADLIALAVDECARHGRTVTDVVLVVTVDRRAAHPGIRALAAAAGAAVRALPVPLLADQQVTEPSAAAQRHLGTSGVAEAAVLAVGAAPLGARRAAAGWTVVLAGVAEPGTDLGQACGHVPCRVPVPDTSTKERP